MIFQCIVAEKLGYTLAELQSKVTVEELMIWNAFYAYRHEEEEKAMERAKKSRR